MSRNNRREERTDLLTPTEVGRLLNVHRSTVNKWIKRGLLPAVRLPSGMYRVRRLDVERILGKQPASSNSFLSEK